MRNHRLASQKNLVRHNRRARNDLVGFQTAVYARSSGDHDIVSYHHMVRQTGLPPDHHVAAQSRAAGDPDLSYDNAILSDRHVMGYLDEIVDFSTALDDSLAKR